MTELKNYSSWDEVNEAMRELALLNIKKQKLEGEQSDKILKIKEIFEQKAAKVTPEITLIEQKISDFVEKNKDEFIKKRTKKLTFGTISYKQTKRIDCKDTDVAIRTLRELDMSGYIKTSETIDKEALKKLDDKRFASLVKAGITLVREDKLKITPDYTELVVQEKIEQNE